MKQLDLADHVADIDYSTWPIDFAMSASFEVPSARLQSALPERFHVIEPRPGVALLNVAVFRFTTGTYGSAAPCTELVASAHVLPDLRHAPMLPRMAMFTFRIGATSPHFIDDAFATDHYPVHPEPLEIRIDETRLTVDARDREGRPIISLAATNLSSPRYESDRFYVQSSTASGGRIYRGGNLFEFRRAENQRDLGRAGTLHPHPFFSPLDLSGVETPCYVQMWSEPGSVGHEFHFFLKPSTLC